LQQFFAFILFKFGFLRDCLIRDYLIHDHLKLVNGYEFGLISLIVLISLTGFAKNLNAIVFRRSADKLRTNCFKTMFLLVKQSFKPDQKGFCTTILYNCYTKNLFLSEIIIKSDLHNSTCKI